MGGPHFESTALEQALEQGHAIHVLHGGGSRVGRVVGHEGEAPGQQGRLVPDHLRHSMDGGVLRAWGDREAGMAAQTSSCYYRW